MKIEQERIEKILSDIQKLKATGVVKFQMIEDLESRSFQHLLKKAFVSKENDRLTIHIANQAESIEEVENLEKAIERCYEALGELEQDMAHAMANPNKWMVIKYAATHTIPNMEKIKSEESPGKERPGSMEDELISTWWFCFIDAICVGKEHPLWIYPDILLEDNTLIFNFLTIYNKVKPFMIKRLGYHPDRALLETNLLCQKSFISIKDTTRAGGRRQSAYLFNVDAISYGPSIKKAFAWEHRHNLRWRTSFATLEKEAVVSHNFTSSPKKEEVHQVAYKALELLHQKIQRIFPGISEVPQSLKSYRDKQLLELMDADLREAFNTVMQCYLPDSDFSVDAKRIKKEILRRMKKSK